MGNVWATTAKSFGQYFCPCPSTAAAALQFCSNININYAFFSKTKGRNVTLMPLLQQYRSSLKANAALENLKNSALKDLNIK